MVFYLKFVSFRLGIWTVKNNFIRQYGSRQDSHVAACLFWFISVVRYVRRQEGKKPNPVGGWTKWMEMFGQSVSLPLPSFIGPSRLLPVR